MDKYYNEDIELISKSSFLDKMSNKTIVITGATGLIGSLLVKGMLKSNNNIIVIAIARSMEKVKRVFEEYLEYNNFIIIVQDIKKKIKIDYPIDYIIHLASATSSKYFVNNPVDTINIAFDGSRNILELGKEKCVESIVYVSSLEVYGQTSNQLVTVKEKDYGYIDPLNVRSSYSEGKRMIECLCAAYLSQYGTPVKIARLGQTFGPGVDYNDGRVFAEFARCCIENRNIVLHTKGNTVRNYCYTRDAALSLLCILINGDNGEAYNVVNQETDISIFDMAQLLVDYFIPDKEVIIEIDNNNRGYNPEVKIKLDVSKLNKIGYNPSVGLLESFQRMICSMKK